MFGHGSQVFFTFLGIYEVQVEDGVVFSYYLLQRRKKAPSLKFINIELENRLEHIFSNLGIQLQVALNFLSIH